MTETQNLKEHEIKKKNSNYELFPNFQRNPNYE
jgi:hypothetical protein